MGTIYNFAHNYMETSHVGSKPMLLKLLLDAGFEPTTFR